MTSKEGLERKHNLLNNYFKKAAKNGVDIKILLPSGTINKEIETELSKVAQIKQNKNNKARFCIIDGKEVLLFLTDDKGVHKSYDCAVWLDAPYFVEYFSSLSVR